MRILKTTLLVSTILLFSFLMVAFAKKTTTSASPQNWLAVEIALSTPLTVNAGTEGHTLKAFWPVPAKANGESPYSAIKLEPKMVGDKVEVTITALSGDISGVKTCKDWKLLKESRLAVYNLSAGEEITVPQLSDLGSNFKNGELTFRAVPSVAPQHEKLGEPCCAHCGGNTCCPGVGNCLTCGGCGQLCC